jgi:hypothetical protein
VLTLGQIASIPAPKPPAPPAPRCTSKSRCHVTILDEHGEEMQCRTGEEQEARSRARVPTAAEKEGQAMTRDDEKIRHDCIRKGYEDCAIFLDGIAKIWREGIRPGHELVADTLTDVARQIRLFKESI